MIALAMSGSNGASAFQIPVLAPRQVVRSAGRTTVSMSTSPATGEGKGLQYNPEKYQDEKNKGNYRKLSEALQVSITCVGRVISRSLQHRTLVVNMAGGKPVVLGALKDS